MAFASQKNLLDPSLEMSYTSPPQNETKNKGRLENMKINANDDDDEFVLNKTLFRDRVNSKSNGNILVPLQPIK